jgi:hypothetical protein
VFLARHTAFTVACSLSLLDLATNTYVHVMLVLSEHECESTCTATPT